MTDAEKETVKRKLDALAKNEIIITYDAPDAPLSAAASRRFLVGSSGRAMLRRGLRGFFRR